MYILQISARCILQSKLQRCCRFCASYVTDFRVLQVYTFEKAGIAAAGQSRNNPGRKDVVIGFGQGYNSVSDTVWRRYSESDIQIQLSWTGYSDTITQDQLFWCGYSESVILMQLLLSGYSEGLSLRNTFWNIHFERQMIRHTSWEKHILRHIS